jgi:Cu(I)/Ag(I) efflux system membrane fusion protein
VKIVRWMLVALVCALLFVFGFGYGRWYSTRRVASKGGQRVLYYVDPMHTWYKSDKPGFAPDCGMKLEPVYAQESGGRGPTQPSAAENALQATPEEQQRLGLRYGTAEWSVGTETIHAAGRVVPDETSIARVQARTDGWISKVSADFTGKFVTKGQPLLTLYSPDLLAAQQEYLLALKARTVMQHSSMQESAANSDALADAAKKRLSLLNLTDAQIADLEQTKKALQSIVLYAPATGFVMTRNAFPGQRVTAETELYTLADLRSVWVMADVQEMDAQRVRVGQKALVSVPGASGPVLAKVSNLQPQIDPSTRTIKVRLDLANPRMQLRPDMWVDVDINLGGTRRLSVPAEAVLDAGTSKTIFVDRGNGEFEQRFVETGTRFSDESGDRVEIVKGLQANERIVTSGVFLLNSESQMKSAGGGAMASMPGMSAPAAATPARTKPKAAQTPAMPDMPDMPKGQKQ